MPLYRAREHDYVQQQNGVSILACSPRPSRRPHLFCNSDVASWQKRAHLILYWFEISSQS